MCNVGNVISIILNRFHNNSSKEHRFSPEMRFDAMKIGCTIMCVCSLIDFGNYPNEWAPSCCSDFHETFEQRSVPTTDRIIYAVSGPENLAQTITVGTTSNREGLAMEQVIKLERRKCTSCLSVGNGGSHQNRIIDRTLEYFTVWE